MTFAVNTAGPSISTVPSAIAPIVIFPPRLIAVPAVKLTVFNSVLPIVPPIVIVPLVAPLPSPETIVRVSTLVPLSTARLFPAISIVLLPVETRSKSPENLRLPVPGSNLILSSEVILASNGVIISPAEVIVT